MKRENLEIGNEIIGKIESLQSKLKDVEKVMQKIDPSCKPVRNVLIESAKSSDVKYTNLLVTFKVTDLLTGLTLRKAQLNQQINKLEKEFENL